MRSAVLTAAVALGLAGPAAAAPEARGLGDPGPLQALRIDGDGAFVLDGRDAGRQLLVTGLYAAGQERDLTRSARYDASPAGVVSIDAAGHVTPLKEGKATITAAADGAAPVKVEVSVVHLVEDRPVDFANEVVPVFTKFGCNAGGCHGKADGQNGFKLSLLGFEPGDDYSYVVREARGRRVFPPAPDHSLILRKAAGLAPHGGGKKLPADSPYYRVLRRWIEQGCPPSRPDAPTVRAIVVLPGERLLDRNSTQQLAVVARYSDGSSADVTRLTQFESNAADLAEVSPTGLVSTKSLPGSAAVMARYQSHVGVFRATVPLGAPVAALPPPKNFVDEHVFRRLAKLGVPPSELCDDATFIRRVTLDLCGRLPTKDEAEAFVADKTDDKRDKLVDKLLASGDYADAFANKWGAVLRNRRRGPSDSPEPTAAFHKWLRDGLADNKPYDRMVREILTTTGEEIKAPPVVWYRELKEPGNLLEDTAQLFLGQRLGCAKCHHHPFERWSQQDYYGFAAFFSRVEVKDPKPAKKGGKTPTPSEPATVSLKAGPAEAVNVRTGAKVRPTGLGGPPLDVGDADPRAKLADWMTDPANPFFARALVNRYWKHFFGRGLVDPEDDMRATNPPTNPELLDALAKDFVASGYDLKKLCRTLTTSRAYQLSAVPNAFNADDRQNFSRFLPRRLNAEVLLDAIDDVTLAKTVFKGAPGGTRAIQLPDNLFDSYFLSVFGRPDAASACECERSSDASLAQALHLFNSAEVLGKVAGARAAQLAADKRPPEERLRDLYLVALAREPSKEELAVLTAYLQKKKGGKDAYEDVIWALLNTKEFLFNH
jgi:hypothetical protein